MRRVLVTRPEPGAAETAQRLRALGFEPVLAPLLRIVPRPGPARPPGEVAAIAITSVNAIPALPPALHGTPLFAVGDATAAAARAAGCTDVRSADGDARDLASLILREVRGTVLLLSGSGQGGPLVASLRTGGLRVVRRVAYAARPEPALPDTARTLLDGGDVHGIVFMSADTSRQFARTLPAGLAPSLSGVVAACISPGSAAPVGHLPWRQLRVSLRPNLRDTLALL